MQMMGAVRQPSSATALNFLGDIDHFPTPKPKSKRALIAFSPDAWLIAKSDYPNIKLFNFYGLTYEIVRALNLNGYIVDITSMKQEHTPAKTYDLFLGHGGKCRTTIERLPQRTPIFQYVSGSHWQGFNIESEERYARYAESRRVPKPSSFIRDLTPILEGENFLAESADVFLTINCPRMVETFGSLKRKFFFTGFGAYPDEALAVPFAKRNFEKGKKGFLYVAGSGGNIQKGLDILLEAFTRCPTLHLYIYCKVEEEVLSTYRKELDLPNIHFIYHLKQPFFRKCLTDLLREINFTIHAPINSGIGTAFMGSLAHGYIPVGYVDLPPHGDCSVNRENWSVDSITDCITEAGEKSSDWCRAAHKQVLTLYNEICGTESLRAKLEEAFSDPHVDAVKRKKLEAGLCEAASQNETSMNS